jgi:hypothetical protein
MGSLWRFLFKIPPDETTLEKRGFRATTDAARLRLEQIGTTFVTGYHAALEERRSESLRARLERTVELEQQGFAFEGAAMALALLDLLLPGRRDRLRSFLAGPARHHSYMVHIGSGWALARLRRPPERFMTRLDPLICWLALDGYGFHEGYFHSRRSVEAREVPPRLRGYAACAFDQGLGRSIWFVEGADVAAIKKRVDSFAAERQADLWGGVGLAACYAGGVDTKALQTLGEGAGQFRPHVAQGAAFAAKARDKAGISTQQTETACKILCGLSAKEAVLWTDAAMEDLPQRGPTDTEPAYEVWRSRLRARFVEG